MDKPESVKATNAEIRQAAVGALLPDICEGKDALREHLKSRTAEMQKNWGTTYKPSLPILEGREGFRLLEVASEEVLAESYLKGGKMTRSAILATPAAIYDVLTALAQIGIPEMACKAAGVKTRVWNGWLKKSLVLTDLAEMATAQAVGSYIPLVKALAEGPKEVQIFYRPINPSNEAKGYFIEQKRETQKKPEWNTIKACLERIDPGWKETPQDTRPLMLIAAAFKDSDGDGFQQFLAALTTGINKLGEQKRKEIMESGEYATAEPASAGEGASKEFETVSE